MAEGGFNDLELLSREELIKKITRLIDKDSAELEAHVNEALTEIVAHVNEALTELRAHINEVLTELGERQEITEEFMEEFCAPHTENMVWCVMWKGGGAYLVTELLRVVDCSKSNLYEMLRSLMGRRLVRMVGKRYQAVSPAWLVRKNRKKQEKTGKTKE